ncbi:unnamed protein product [Bursaphelenchus xylophilus]|uniref:(pine wood nematode) hypothetical protein n=1 Tax=Bursaphelenchus xylophilus TaxID=6326 RepID=A0A1I7S173_BURXY|nr:unnamed protein product [Bursaphelenchus xylophilus]CAG9080061.1 unnamed protein product [Bursaphelenchus xylophilus]
MPFYWLFLFGITLACLNSSDFVMLQNPEPNERNETRLTLIHSQEPVVCADDGQDSELTMVKCFYRYTEWFRNTSYDDFTANFERYTSKTLAGDYVEAKKNCNSFGKIIACVRQYACESTDILFDDPNLRYAYFYMTGVCKGSSQKEAEAIGTCGMDTDPKLHLASTKGSCSEEFIADLFQQFKSSCRTLKLEQVVSVCESIIYLFRGYCLSGICERVANKVWNKDSWKEMEEFEEYVNDLIKQYNKELPALFEQVKNGDYTNLITKF